MSHDVFISYAHNDNLPEPGASEGWVTHFRDCLTSYLTGYIGKSAQVWRDEERMGGGEFLTHTLRDSLRESQTLISIISPSYLNSKWCQEELNFFWEEVGSRVGNRSRVFAVVKLPPAQMPSRFEDLLRFQFFELTRNNVPLPLSPEDDRFRKEIGNLAYTIAERIKELEALKTPGKTIYLAETTGDMRGKRKNVRDDLIQRGFSVLPLIDEEKPVETAEYQASVREDIKKSDLAVHLIGRNYGDCAPDDNRSYVHLQAITAAERDNDSNFSRLIWMPDDLEQNPNFMQELLESAKKNVDVFRDPSIENLKTRIQDILAGKLQTEAGAGASDDGEEIIPNVYVFCEKSDANDARKLENNLFDLECEIFSARNLAEQDSDESFAQHEKYLQETNGVVIYWKNPQLQNWIQLIVSTLSRKINKESLGVYLGDNPEERDYYRTHRAQIIRNDDELKGFVETLKLRLGGN
jgi:TIR domain/Domain of unknown function (DUF4062)